MCIKKEILRTLTYFNMFDYPLTKREIFLFLGDIEEVKDFDMALNILSRESVIFKIGEFYSLQDRDSLALRRTRGNARAASMMKRASLAARIISLFPYVKGVAVSGSLSKRFAEENADIDFFIIAEANRLWLCRTFLHLFKKITYIFRMQHYFCMNYFIDEEEYMIREKNIYTAVEVVTLIPMYGTAAFESFFKCNPWTKEFLPNNYMRVSSSGEIKMTWIRKIVERIFNNSVGYYLDSFLMKLTEKSWKAKTRKNIKTAKGFTMKLDTGKHFAKPDPGNFQKRLLERYESEIRDHLLRWGHLPIDINSNVSGAIPIL